MHSEFLIVKFQIATLSNCFQLGSMAHLGAGQRGDTCVAHLACCEFVVRDYLLLRQLREQR